MLAGCCFFGTCVEAKPKKGVEHSSVSNKKNKKFTIPTDIENLGNSGFVSLSDYACYNDWKRSLKENKKKQGLVTETWLKDKDEKVEEAFIAYVDKEYDGLVDSCFIVDSLEGCLMKKRLNISWKSLKKAVTKVVKELKDEGKRPFRKGVDDIKEMLVQGRILSFQSSIDFMEDVDFENGRSAYSKEFIKRLVKELKVDFDTLYKDIRRGLWLFTAY